jgi:hypothetical protein
LTELRVVDSMHERKATMASLVDGFAVLPGGLGTLDETFEALTGPSSAFSKPVGALNVEGYWDSLRGLIEHAVRELLVKPAVRRALAVRRHAGRAARRLRGLESAGSAARLTHARRARPRGRLGASFANAGISWSCSPRAPSRRSPPASCAGAEPDHTVRGDDEVERHVVRGHRDRVVDDLSSCTWRPPGIVVDEPERVCQGVFQITVAAALAEPRAGPIDGDAAGHDEIDRPICPGNTGTPRVEAPIVAACVGFLECTRVQPQEAALGAQARDRHDNGLALAQGRQPDGPLGSIRIALDSARRLPLR